MSLSQSLPQGKPTTPVKSPTALIQSLYTRVIARHPSGIPSGIDWKIFAPYMSKQLLHRVSDFNACSAEWGRIPQDPRYAPVKAPFGIYESGIFSGDDERTEPKSFKIEGSQSQKDGSVRVDVSLAWWEKQVGARDKWQTYADKPWIWHVAAIVVQQDGHSVVDDVIYVTERQNDSDYRLSQALARGCNGPHYVGPK
jgi:hypothetical protein